MPLIPKATRAAAAAEGAPATGTGVQGVESAGSGGTQASPTRRRARDFRLNTGSPVSPAAATPGPMPGLHMQAGMSELTEQEVRLGRMIADLREELQTASGAISEL